MKVEKIDGVDYLQFKDDRLRVSHATDLLTPIPNILEAESSGPEFLDKVEREIRNRKKIMCSLHLDILALEDILEETE